MIIHLYPDSNAFYSDRFLKREYSTHFIALLDAEAIQVTISPIVVLESKRHALEEAQEAIRAMNRAIRTLEHETQIDGSILRHSIDGLASSIEDHAETALNPVLAHNSTHALPMPVISVGDLAHRELDRKRPFLDKPVGTIGLRDMLIWQNLLEAVDPDSDDVFLFITKDKGFLDESQTRLHDDLIADLDEIGVQSNKVRVIPDIARATVEARRLADLVSERNAQLEEWMISYAGELHQYQWGTHFDAQDGGLVEGETQPATLPQYLEDPLVASAEYLQTISIGEGTVAECVALYVIEFDAQMSTQEYFSGSYPDIEWWHGDVDDHYIGVHTTRKVLITLHIEYDTEAQIGSVEDMQFEWAQTDAPEGLN
ncbi:PIN domain-containing protein [Clavibacter californiensis]|uniref:PIN domain-containing protein n=1 Tax=Clavibacter californiensis TaxID=1401995 RepID=UPI0011C21A1D|nr:PIN domain-containing protein [Clavibacter californiensis]UKF79917.1 PIN domain-containing protein [Clavibacter californiensis]